MSKPKRIVEEFWPHGRRVIREQEAGETEVAADEKMAAFLSGIAVSAKTTGLLDQEGPEGVVKLLKKAASHPADLMRELRKMGAQAGRAKQAVQQIRKGL
jgi:hypothetical protein